MKAFFSTVYFGYEKEIAEHAIKYCKDELLEQLEDDFIDRNKDEMKEEARSEDAANGFLILRIQSLEKRSKLEEFLCKEIYPFYNEQQAELFNIPL